MTSPQHTNVRRRWSWNDAKHDLPASFVVFLVALPLCMGVAIASGAPVTAGLVTGIVGGIIVGFLAGSPMQVSGPAAGLTVLVYQFIHEHGIESLGPAVLLAGGLQVVAAFLHLGQWFRAVSPAVIQGMLAGIGVLILAGQFHVMIDDQPSASGWRNLATIPQAVYKSFTGPPIGSVTERQDRIEELRAMSDLHFKQSELAEQVHHLVTTAEPSPTNPGPKRSAKKRPPSPSSSSDADDIAARLQALAPVQLDVTENLRRRSQSLPNEIRQRALADSEVALSDLQVGNTALAKSSQDRAEASLLTLRDSRKSHRSAALLGALTIGLILVWQGVFARRVKFLPAPLVAVGTATIVSAVFCLPVVNVEVPDNLLEEIFLPSLAELSLLFDGQMVLSAVEIAVIASAETLLCASAVDKLHRGQRTQYDRELGAQGIGNMICGLLSALPMTGVIVRSSANIHAGARTRMSAVFHGVWILVLVALFAHLLRLIPTCSLAAVLVYTGYKLVNIKAVKDLWKQGRFEVAIYVVTMTTIVAVDLLTGVLVGVALAIAKLVYILSHLEIRVDHHPSERRSVLELKGSATFLRLPRLAAALESVPPGHELRVNVEQLDYIDHASLDLLHDWERQHAPQGSQLTLDHDSLAARFWRRMNRVASDGELAAAPQQRKRQVPI